MLVGVGLCLAGLVSMIGEAPTPMPLSIAMWLVGFGNLATSFYALRRVRVAWSFSISINATAGLVFLFAAPRLRDAFETSLLVALLPVVLLVAITTLLAMAADELEPTD